MRLPRVFVLLPVLLLVACGDSGSRSADGEVAAPTVTTVPAVTTTSAAPPAADVVFPAAAWATDDPAAHGIDPADLQALDRYYESSGSNCVAVVKDGYLVHEAYWNDYTPETDQEIFSATKSVTATLVGIAQDRGALDIDDPASVYLTEWQRTPSEDVTIRNLLSNDSGREYDFRTDYLDMATGAPDKTAFAVGLVQQHEPGTTWAYNNSAIQTLEAVLERSTGQGVGDFAQEHLFGPLGMTSEIHEDAAGNALTFMGAQASCQDLARFGHLALNRGNWDGEQVVSAAYMEEATSPSQGLNTIYGFLWWLNGDGRRVDSPATGAETVTDDGSLSWPDAPEDAYAAQGLGGQFVIVVPSENLVITRLGNGEGRSDPNDIIRIALGD